VRRNKAEHVSFFSVLQYAEIEANAARHLESVSAEAAAASREATGDHAKKLQQLRDVMRAKTKKAA
jgi:hypothetical protein